MVLQLRPPIRAAVLRMLAARATRAPRRLLPHIAGSVRDDQPVLSYKLGGGGHVRAARSGKRERRTAIATFAAVY